MDDVCFKSHCEISMLTVSKHNYNFNMKHLYLRSSFSKSKVGKSGYFMCYCSINSKHFYRNGNV